MKRSNVFLFFISLLFSYYGCRETNITNTDPTEQKLKIKKSIISEDRYFLFEYQNEDLIFTKFVSKDTTEETIKFIYDSNKRRIEIKSTGKSESDLSYHIFYGYGNDDKIISMRELTYKNGIYQNEHSIKYEYDAFGRVTKVINSQTNELEATLKYDSFGNVVELNSFKDGKMVSKETYEYDTCINPFYEGAPYSVLSAEVNSKNNLIKKTYTDSTVYGKHENITYNNFTYNSQNYPISLSYTTIYKSSNSESQHSGFVRYEYY